MDELMSCDHPFLTKRIFLFVAGGFSGILTGAVCGYSAIIGSKYLNATMTGIGIGALGVGSLRIITKASLSFAENGNAISCVIYFFISVVFCWLTAVLFFWMERQPFTRLHFERAFTEVLIKRPFTHILF